MSTTSKQLSLRFAVIGCGMLARSQHIPNIVRSSKAKLQDCCDVSTEALDICKKEFHPVHASSNFHEVIRDPLVDAICLASTEKLRLPVIATAAAVDKPVYIEKPLAGTLEEVYQIQKIVHESKIPFCVGHNAVIIESMFENVAPLELFPRPELDRSQSQRNPVSGHHKARVH